MLADEGHHLNADTKSKQIDFTPVNINRKGKDAEVERSWENTVIEKILIKGTTEIQKIMKM